MNSAPVAADKAARDLRPDQCSFLDRFFTTESSRHTLLTGPCGVGQFHLVVALVQRAVETQNPKRVLLIVPDHLRDCYSQVLAATIRTRPVESVDLSRYRELLSADNSWFRDPMISVISNHGDWLERLGIMNWDLAIIQDDMMGSGSPWQSVDCLLKAEKLSRCLFIRGDSARSLPACDIGGLVEVVWKAENILNNEGIPLFGLDSRSWKKWDYVRDPKEQQVVSEIISVARLVQESDLTQMFKDMLLLRAASGISALETATNTLLRNFACHPQSKIEGSHSISEPAEVGENADSFMSAARRKGEIWTNASLAFREIDAINAMFDEIHGDNKLDGLVENIESLFTAKASKPVRICVYSSFKETVSYLQSALSEETYRVHVITDSTPFNQREQALATLGAGDGVVIATPQAMECLPPFPFTDVVHYELPATQCELSQRFGGCKVPCTNYILVDKSGVNDLEERLRKSHGIVGKT